MEKKGLVMTEKVIVAIHRIGEDKCSFSGKTGEGMWCSFQNGSIKNQFLTHASFKKLVSFQYPKEVKSAVTETTGTETVTQPVDGVPAANQRRS